MRIAQFRCSNDVTIILEYGAYTKEYVRVSEWMDVKFQPRREVPFAESLAALDAEERAVKRALDRIDKKRAALQEAT